MNKLHRLWCRLFHNDFMLPWDGKVLCRKCLEMWDVDLPRHTRQRPFTVKVAE